MKKKSTAKEIAKFEQGLLYNGMSRNEIAMKLQQIGEEKNLVKKAVGRYKASPYYSTVFNQEEVESQLLFTIVATINSLEKYNTNKKNLFLKALLEKNLTKAEFKRFMTQNETAKLKVKIEGLLNTDEYEKMCPGIRSAEETKLRLDSESFITGYLIKAFSNNIKKMYAQHQTDKRSCSQIIYLDSYADESENSSAIKNKLESHISETPVKQHEFQNALVSMAKYLKAHDRKQNRMNPAQKSQLTKLFCSIVNPKKVQTSEDLRETFGWSQYLLNKNKDLLIQKLKDNFMDHKEDILDYLDQREMKGKAS